jgi:hypothetical protein
MYRVVIFIGAGYVDKIRAGKITIAIKKIGEDVGMYIRFFLKVFLVLQVGPSFVLSTSHPH